MYIHTQAESNRDEPGDYDEPGDFDKDMDDRAWNGDFDGKSPEV